MNMETARTGLAEAAGEGQVKEITRTVYAKNIEAMRSWAIRSRTRGADEIPLVNTIDLAKDIMARTDISASTKNAYRAALLWHLRRLEKPDSGDQEARQILEAWAPWELPKPKLRPRSIRLSDVELLNDELLAQGGKWALRTSHWLQAALATGLRPREWLDARWLDESKTSLHVTCAKTKLNTPAFLLNQERYEQRSESYGTGVSERTVPVEKDFERMLIDAHMRNIQASIDPSADAQERARQFARYYSQCRTCLHRACQKLWDGRKVYSLYTMRSQFSANAKAAHGSERAAILMGHTSADTPSTGHYGKANQAHKSGGRVPAFTGSFSEKVSTHGHTQVGQEAGKVEQA